MSQREAAAPYVDSQAVGITTIRVVSVPAGHPYVQRMTADDVVVLPDPTPPGAAPGQWWPPVALDADWIEAHRFEADLLHIHFGTESLDVTTLRDALAAARAVGWPVVYTVHDLDNPQLTDQTLHHEHLELLVREADAIVTLTPGAADEVQARWHRAATVIPHPRILGDDVVTGAPGIRSHSSIGIHLKDLRPNVDGVGTVSTAVAAIARLNERGVDARLEVRMHSTVRDPSAAAAVRAAVDSSPHTELVVHERFSDDELATALATLDVCILPYRHGTHSGWLELCWDLAVPVASPTVGHYRDQHPDGSVALFAPGSVDELAAAIADLLDPANPATARTGTPQRAALSAARLRARRDSDAAAARVQARLYRDVVAAHR